MAAFEPYPTDVFQMLKNDHLELSRLMEDVLISVEDNEKLMLRLYDELMEHMRLEERYLYPELADRGVTNELMRISLGQHEEIKRLLHEVLPQDPRTEEWLDDFQKLQEIQALHVEEEEQEVFPQVRNFLAKREIDRILSSIQAEKTTGASAINRRMTRRSRPPRIRI